MDPTILIGLAIITAFFGGMAFGFLSGLGRGLTLGLRFRAGRPLSPLPWIFCFIVAGIFLLAALGSAIHSIHFLARSDRAMGMVTEIVERKDNAGDVSRSAVYSYVDASGQRFTNRSTGGGGTYSVGDTIWIRYVNGSPEQARVDHFSRHWGLPLILGFFASILGVAGFCLRWWRAKEQQWADKRLQGSGTATVISP